MSESQIRTMIAVALIGFCVFQVATKQSKPAPGPTPAVPVVPASQYQADIDATFVDGPHTLHDVSYLYGVFRESANFVRSDAGQIIKTRADFVAYSNELGDQCRRNVQGKYSGFDAFYTKIMQEAQKTAPPSTTEFSPAERQAFANTLEAVANACLHRSRKLVDG